MSYAFEGNCTKTLEYERQIFDFYPSAKNFFQQGEAADEAARVCLDSGDLETGYEWFKISHDAGLQEHDIKPARPAVSHTPAAAYAVSFAKKKLS